MEDEEDDYEAEDFDPESECLICGGEGWVTGDTLMDPLYWNVDKAYTCRSCGGSGLAKDMTYC